MRYIALFICLLVAACHGSSGSGGSNNNPNNSLPADPTLCSAADPFSGSIVFPIVAEVEPNDDVSVAYGVTLPTPAQAGDRVGLVINGTVHGIADRMDTFSFASSRSRTFFFKLCESTCNMGSGNDRFGNPDSLDVWIAYFSVLDASGNVLITTETNQRTENYVRLCVPGGVITYIRVVANNTMNALQNYKISAVETL